MCVEVWWFHGDRAAGDHDEDQGCLRGVQDEGSPHEESDSAGETFGASVGAVVFGRGEDPGAIRADGVAKFDERWPVNVESLAEARPSVGRSAGKPAHSACRTRPKHA